VPRSSANGSQPHWNLLYEKASTQAGYFTAKQARTAGYSSQLLQFYLRENRVERWSRGIFRLVHFPPTDREDLVPIWLWSEQKGVFSHETALGIHELSDLLPAKRHVTLPLSWSRRRLRPPTGVVLHHADLDEGDWSWFGAIPVTTPLRSVLDCMNDHVSKEFVDQAIVQGVRRHLFTRAELRAAARFFQRSP
jgi:predicted transcriptional regulator of viral defense system